LLVVTADERLGLIQAKVQRAREHLGELQSGVQSFLATDPYQIETKRDTDARLAYYLSAVQETPVAIAFIAGDVLHNLRSALDHLAYQLVLVGTGQEVTSSRVYFPIADSLVKYQQVRDGQTKGMTAAARAAIDNVQPYKGGNDRIWQLHKLNIIDKHRLLITVGSMFESVDLGGHLFRRMSRELTAANGALAEELGSATLQAFFKPADRMFPLKAGLPLFTDGPDAVVDSQLEFRFAVALGEAEADVDGGEPIVETLQEMAAVVDKVVSDFKTHLV
jgi:hypothetical protein